MLLFCISIKSTRKIFDLEPKQKKVNCDALKPNLLTYTTPGIIAGFLFSASTVKCTYFCCYCQSFCSCSPFFFLFFFSLCLRFFSYIATHLFALSEKLCKKIYKKYENKENMPFACYS